MNIFLLAPLSFKIQNQTSFLIFSVLLFLKIKSIIKKLRHNRKLVKDLSHADPCFLVFFAILFEVTPHSASVAHP